MKNNKYLVRIIAGVLILSAFTACTKSTIKTVSQASTIPVDSTNLSTSFAAPVGAGVAVTVKPSDWMIDGANVPAGSVIYIPAGNRGALLLKNLKGTTAAPIIIINQGGKVTFTAPASAGYAFKAQNCQNFKIMGNGAPGVTYGFDVNGANIGMTMEELSSYFEIAFVEVRNSGFAGIMAKTDPTCDQATWRGHFTMKNAFIHNNYVHKTGGEGLYIGNSFYKDGVSTSCGTVLPHAVVNLRIYKNLIDSTGSEGIQVGSATLGCEIYKNIVKHPGASPMSAFQDNGIQLGEGTGGKCYNNYVKGAPGNGIIVLGLGDNLLYNNYIINSKGYGIFADSRYTPGPNFQFINNTIIGSALGGVKLNSETIPMNTVINNVIIQAGGAGLAVIRKSTDVKLTSSNNYVSADVNTCKFVNYATGDLHLQSTSPLINNGVNVSLYGISFDYFLLPRPVGGAFDIGATEY